MYRIVFLLLSSLTILNCSGKSESKTNLPFYNEPTFTPLFLTNKAEIKAKINHTIADFSFLNQDSIVIDQSIIEDKIHIANFIFTSCASICPIMTKNMKIVSDSLQKDNDIIFLSYSVTPWIDKPEVLKKFKENYGIKNKNWHFFTGLKSEIYSLARQSYFAEEDIGFSKDSTEFLHTEHFILVDKCKRIRGIYNGTLVLEMEQLIEDINTLKQENK
ncbi:MAG: SCO family protein [Cellulophaga sp.]